MRLAVGVVCISLLSTLPAKPQTDCKTIADSVARLACYDKAGPKTPAKNPSADQFDSVKAAVVKAFLFKDPQSAQFTDLVRAMRTNGKGELVDTVCGTVNAKNSYGAYTGAKRFVYFYKDNSVQIAGEGGPTMGEVATTVVNNFCK
jgi:hypothetical protein